MRPRGIATLVAIALCVGCSTGGGAPAQSPMPTGIAQLMLPMDAASLRRVAAEDDPPKRLERRTQIVSRVQRQVLMAPVDDALVPEMFDVLVALAPHMESGRISAAWASYIYTTYERDLAKERPTGAPRRSHVEIDRTLGELVAYYHIRENPNATPPASPERQGFDAIREWRDERRLGR
jgi:hypothetical protein